MTNAVTGAASTGARAALTLRALLLCLMLAQMIPFGLLAAGVLGYYWDEQHTRLHNTIRDTAATKAEVIEGDLESTQRALMFLGTSPLLVRDFAAFRERVAQAAALYAAWSNVVLLAEDGRQLINLRASADQPLPNSGDRPHQIEAIRTGRAQVSDVFIGRVTGEPVVDVVIPVQRPGENRYLLSASLSLPHLAARLSHKLQPLEVAAILDRSLRYVSHSTDPSVYVGLLPDDHLLEAIRAAPSGTTEVVDRSGTRSLIAWAPVDSAGWTVLYERRTDAATLPGTLGTLALVWLAILLLGIAMAALVSRRLASVASQLALAAQNVGRDSGKDAAASVGGIAEFAAIEAGVVSANQRLAQEAQARRQAEEERDHLMQQEHQARQAAETANRAKDEFLAVLGHELRNPIAAILNSAHLVRRVPGADEQTRAAADIIVRQAGHLQVMIEDLLDISRITARKLVLSMRPVSLPQVVDAAVQGLRAAAMLDRHDLRVDLPDEPLWVDGDPDRLAQVVVNIVTNALRYTPEDGAIHVQLRRQGDDAVLKVIDTGIGMTRDTLARAFDPFFQAPAADERRIRKGLGVGLSLVDRLVRLHGGRVAAASPGPGLGSTITVTLPLAMRAAGAAEAPAADREA
ncbi:MAG TPA: ATP-binding protein [Burkholderiaceae bacterium]|nr:ATP-binding protein [Burkholderiaceae bacterium]